ncbi:hypothetical protein F9C28_14480 [Shimwellia pseudoproteus]|uniref:thioredoxin family protein n=1 Tax=Shimwellia pseudoproteus TaxID=570012 RepID=UPI0018EA485D|nr:thioredoxin domain-containing protein [Shimwellia pseudoproteus]MBJ3816101.1 hypothetical protein [Shimwellia pseudoproteus]
MIDITAAQLPALLADSNTPVLLDVWAPWCAPCLALEPWLQRLSGRYGDRLTIARCDVDQNNDLIAAYGLRGVPTLIGFAAGQEIARCTGGNVAQLHALVNRLLETQTTSATGGAFNGDNVTKRQLIDKIAVMPEEQLAEAVAAWMQRPGDVPGIPARVWQLMLFLAQQYPAGESNAVFCSLLEQIAPGTDLSDTGRRLVISLLGDTASGINGLFSQPPAVAQCWQALAALQLSQLRGSPAAGEQWQAALAQHQQLREASDLALVGAADNLALFTTPVNSNDITLFLELYRLASDEQADMLYATWPEGDIEGCSQAIGACLQQALVRHTTLLGEVLAGAPCPLR